jgi:cell division protein FtsB
MPRSLTILLIVLLAGLQYRLWVGPGSLAHVHRLNTEVETLLASNAERAARNAALEAEVADLGAGIDAIEARARNQLGLVREGERFYLVVQTKR